MNPDLYQNRMDPIPSELVGERDCHARRARRGNRKVAITKRGDKRWRAIPIAIKDAKHAEKLAMSDEDLAIDRDRLRRNAVAITRQKLNLVKAHWLGDRPKTIRIEPLLVASDATGKRPIDVDWGRQVRNRDGYGLSGSRSHEEASQ